ncbi:MAG: hypothetical protein KatS3mg110_0553 [Pirellulaceae bacterium]|nr:MAG: hypothetical protein KatS3mg110_0553 [Pirellulaceae bacterium]
MNEEQPFSHEKEQLRRMLELFQPAVDRPDSEPWLALHQQLEGDPKLRQWWHQMQRMDEKIRDAFREVAIPEALAERIVDRLRSSHSPQVPAVAGVQPPNAIRDVADCESQEGAVCEQAAAEPLPQPVSPPGPDGVIMTEAGAARAMRGGWRRRALLAVGGLAVAAGVAALALWLLPPAVPLTEQQLAYSVRSMVDSWVEHGQQPSGGWRPYEAAEPVALLRWRPQYWAQVSVPWDHQARVYTVRSGQTHFYLFQIRHSNQLGLPPVPSQPLPSSGAWKMGAWYASGCIYVAVTNDPRWLDGLSGMYRPA